MCSHGHAAQTPRKQQRLGMLLRGAAFGSRPACQPVSLPTLCGSWLAMVLFLFLSQEARQASLQLTTLPRLRSCLYLGFSTWNHALHTFLCIKPWCTSEISFLLPLFLFIIVLEILVSAVRKEKEIKGMQSAKEEIQLSLFSDNILENPKESSQKLPKLIGEFNKIAGYHVNA